MGKGAIHWYNELKEASVVVLGDEASPGENTCGAIAIYLSHAKLDSSTGRKSEVTKFSLATELISLGRTAELTACVVATCS